MATVSVKKTKVVPAKKVAAAKAGVKQALKKDMAADAKMAKSLGMGGGRSTPGVKGLPFKSGGKVGK